ncbi:MAG: J domain-containing protein [Spirochaetes bacterium]|nr:J domain-containing protein [Spirochaetota bacterium]
MIADPYKTLGVPPTASGEEIAKAYRRLAKKYHPDLNKDNEKASKMMSEINAAYRQIKNGGSGGKSEYGQGNASGEYDPFGGFGPFGYGQQQQQRTYSVFDPVRHFLRAGYFDAALNVLSSIADKTAEWYFLSAVANTGYGNTITALNHAQTAVQMEPENVEYQQLLDQIQRGGRMYQEESRSYGMPIGNIRNICIGVCLSNMLCMFCGRPC